jgi:hypothetical protein
MKPIAKAQKDRQSLINGSHLCLSKLTKHAPDSPIVDGSQMVNQREGFLGEAARAGREGRIEQSLAGSPGYRHYTHKWKRWSRMMPGSLTTMQGLTPCCS